MRRSIARGIGLFISALLLLLLFSSVLSLAAPSAGTDSVVGPGDGSGSAFTGAKISPAASFATEVGSGNGQDPDILWGWETAQGDRQDGQYPTWLTNLPPRPRTGASPPLPASPSAEQPDFLRFEWADQIPHTGAQLSAPESHLIAEGLSESHSAAAYLWASEPGGLSLTTPASVLAPQLAYTVTLATIHRAIDGEGFSSTFVVTNSTGVAADYYLGFFWPNGINHHTEGPYTLPDGESHFYDMAVVDFGVGTYAGYVEISSDQLLEGRIVTPDYGLISGIVYESNGSTPLQIHGVSVSRFWDDAGFGNVYNLSDGRFYVGGLPDDDYVLQANAPYPWANQYYDGKDRRDQADPITITGAGETPIVVTMQPGGRISGTVFASDGVTRLENVNVDVEQGGYGVCTDANGEFGIRGVPYGDYKVVAGQGWNWCLGTESIWITEYYYESADSEGATVLSLNEGDDTFQNVDFTLDEGGTIEGTVYSEDGSVPLENVNVDIEQGGYGACTDASGHYTISGLPYDDYKVRAGGGWNWCLDADSQYVEEYYQEQSNPDSADIVPVDGGTPNVTGIDFTLSEGGSILGRVTDASSGDGVADVWVWANFYDDGSWGQGAWTDADGYYTISGLPDQDYRVAVEGQDLPEGYAQQFYPDQFAHHLAEPVAISGGITATDVDFHLVPGGTITGVVLDAGTGEPISNINVDLGIYNGDGGMGTCTDASGHYTFTGAIYADYVVQASGSWNHCQDLPPEYARTYYNGVYAWDQATLVVVDEFTTDITGIDFDLEPGGSILGQVTDDEGNPLENINIGTNMPGTSIGDGLCSGPDGYYEIYGLPYGDYVVQAGSDWNWCTDGPFPYIVEYWEEVHNYEEATLVAASETPQTDINFTLSEGGSITGRVTAAADGSPLADVWVSADPYDGGGGGRGAQTDADGYYTITALLDGDYRIAIQGDDVPYGYAQQFYPDQFAHHLADRVTILDGGPVTGIDFNLLPGGIITGTIFDQATGLPLANINVNSGLMDGDGGMGTCSDADGSFTLRGAIYADYAVSAGGDWNHCLDQQSEYIQKFYDGVYSWNDATPVTVNDPDPVTGINLEMEHGGYISGNVSDTGDSAVVGLQVAAVIPGGCPWCHEWLMSTETDASGDYLLGPLPPSDVAVYACASCNGQLYVDEWYDDVWNIDAATLIPVSTGDTVPGIDFVIDPGVLVTGTVYESDGTTPIEGAQVDVWEESDNGYGTGGQTDASGFYQVPVPPIYDSYWSVSVNPWGTDLGAQWAHGFDLSRQTNWDFDLGPGATIAGTITSDGVPVEGAQVGADSPWMGNGAETDAAGNYEITNLPPGEYNVYAGGWPDYMETYYGGHNRDYSTRVWLEEGEYQGGIDIDIKPLGRLYGTVYEADGTTPIEGVRVFAMNEYGFWDAWTEADGRFYLDVPAGDFRVRFIADPWWSRVVTYYGDAYSYATAAVVSVPPYYPDEQETDIFINLEPTATLEGTVVDEGTGDPVGGVMVSVEVRDPAVDLHVTLASDCTDETGQYHIDGVWPGENKVWASGACSGSDYGVVTDTLTAVAGGSHVLDIEVTAGSALRPFTIHTTNSGDYTPLSSNGLAGLTYADEILPALFTPLVDLDDQNEWASELLVQVPTIDNGGAVVEGDQLVVTYELLPGLLWSDGAPLTSDDIRFTWELMTQPSPDVDSYLVYINPLWQIESIDTSEELTAVVTYRPEAFPPGFEGVIGYLLPEHVLAGKNRVDVRYDSDYAHYPVGNGPYIVGDYVPGSHIDLLANPNYHRRDEGLPRIEEVRFLFANDINSALPNGAADVALDVNPDAYAGLDIPTQTRIKGSFSSIVPNTDLPFFEDVQVRRALYYAMDRDQYIDGYGTYAVKADAYLPPEHPMFSDSLVYYDFDPDRAADMLAAAGWTDHNDNGIRDKDGVEFEFDLTYNIGNDARQGLCLIWQEDLATIGVDLNCVPMEWSELIDAGRRGELDAYTMGWIFDSRVDPMAYYLFHSRYVPSAYNSYWGGNPNNRWVDPDPTKTDAWLEAARTELDPDQLRGYYADHLARFTDQLPTWVYNHGTRTDAYIPILHNFTPGQATAATWNIAEWALEPNPYDVAVRKRLAADSPAPQPDTNIVYEILVHNYGTQPMTNIRLLDYLPAEVEFVSATPTEVSYVGHTLTWNLGTIPASTSAVPVQVTVHIPDVPHGTILTNEVEVYGDEADTRPSNNGFVHTIEVRDDVDLAVSKAGVGQAAIGAEYTYLIDYANWGGAPAEGVVITDTLPAEVEFQSAEPGPTEVNGLELTWVLDEPLDGNQWGGQIEVTTLIAEAGTITNTANISLHPDDIDLSNNMDQAIEDIDEILAPIITQPTQGTTGREPLFRGLAAPGATVELWDLADGGLRATSLGTIVADSGDGTWELPLTLDEGTYAIAATATADALTSGYSNEATIIVDHALPLDTNSVSISTNDVDITRGVVRADRRTLGYRTLVIEAEIPCAGEPEPTLRVIENGLWNYVLPPVSVTDLGGDLWGVAFHLWMSDPHSTYDIWMDWDCDGTPRSVRLLSVVIDPDGYVYDDSLVQAGALITDSLILDAQVTAYVWRADLGDDGEWQLWPASSYGQTNPQWTDSTTPDGVLEEGYYSFLTPPGQYRIMAEAPGYQPYQSSVLTVINEPIHLDIPLKPVVGGGGVVVAPANMGESSKQVDLHSARKNETLTYNIQLVNSGEWDTGVLALTDDIPANTAYVSGSLNWSGGGSAEYNGAADAVTWDGVVPAGSEVHISFQVRVTTDEGAPFDIKNVAVVEGPEENLSSLPDLAATTTVEARGYAVFLPIVLRNY